MPARSRRWPWACLETRRRSPAVRCRPRVLFNEITELPLALNPKLLPNLCGNSKISKNKRCSKFKVLQLCFYNHTQIRSTFWNASLKSKGDTLRIYPFSKYFKFYITTLKTPKTNFVHLDKLYTVAFKLNPKMCLDFEMGFSRVNLNAEIRVFRKFKSIQRFRTWFKPYKSTHTT